MSFVSNKQGEFRSTCFCNAYGFDGGSKGQNKSFAVEVFFIDYYLVVSV